MNVTPPQALKLVQDSAPLLARQRVRLDAQAVGRVLARDVRALQASPRWTVSAMDGFALRSADADLAQTQGLPVIATAHAGDLPLRARPGSAIRIMTGAVVPAGADAVVPFEHTDSSHDRVVVNPTAAVRAGDYIRRAGEETQRGDLIVERGTRLTSRWIGALCSAGLGAVWVHRLPRVGLIISGDELVQPGAKLKPGQIHNSNGPMLEGALREQGLVCTSRHAPDDPRALVRMLRVLLGRCDVILLSGGVSVGDADHSKGALKQIGVRTVFWGVRQKPGKPLFFGKRARALVFGLPGNPAAAWICFHEYVRPALARMQGLHDEGAHALATSRTDLPRDAQKTLLLKAQWDGNGPGSQVTLLDGQQSHMLHALARANALAVVHPDSTGRQVEVHPL